MRAGGGAMSAVAVVMACLALWACGDDERSDAAVKAAPANAGTSSGLGPERFKALDAVYVASLPLDRFTDDEDGVDAKEFTAATQPTITACKALDRDDPLLGPVRRLCPLVTQFTERLLGVGACEAGDPGVCRDLIGEARRTLGRFQRLGRRADRVIERTQLQPACRNALVTPELAYEVFDGYDRALALLERGLIAGSVADVERSERVLARSDAKAKKLPNAKRYLELFRSGCA